MHNLEGRIWQRPPGKVLITDRDFADVPEGASMYIATPAIVDSYIRCIPAGTQTSLQQMRKDLAAEHKAAYLLPQHIRHIFTHSCGIGLR